MPIEDADVFIRNLQLFSCVFVCVYGCQSLCLYVCIYIHIFNEYYTIIYCSIYYIIIYTHRILRFGAEFHGLGWAPCPRLALFPSSLYPKTL